jgi:8-oxo-dGTP pyrophosphatase MutT (NUDIX family)
MNIKPAIAVILINREGKVLLQKRSDVKLWGIPSGHVEPGETVEEAAVREVKEETGLNIKITKLIGVYSSPDSQIFYYPDGRVTHFVTTCFKAETNNNQLSIDGKETLEARFFHPTEFPVDLLPMHPLWLQDALADREEAVIR